MWGGKSRVILPTSPHLRKNCIVISGFFPIPSSLDLPEKQKSIYWGHSLSPLMLSLSTHSWRHVSQSFMPICLSVLEKQCFNCQFQISIKLLLLGGSLFPHCWTLWATRCVFWSEEYNSEVQIVAISSVSVILYTLSIYTYYWVSKAQSRLNVYVCQHPLVATWATGIVWLDSHVKRYPLPPRKSAISVSFWQTEQFLLASYASSTARGTCLDSAYLCIAVVALYPLISWTQVVTLS